MGQKPQTYFHHKIGSGSVGAVGKHALSSQNVFVKRALLGLRQTYVITELLISSVSKTGTEA